MQPFPVWDYVAVVVDDGFAPLAAGHDVVEGVFVFNAGRAGHGVESAGGCVKKCCMTTVRRFVQRIPLRLVR